MTKQRFYFDFEAGAIDREAGIIRDVSVVTQGLARGHGVVVDEVMAAQVAQKMSAKRGGLKVKLDHGYSAMQIVGKLRKPRIEGKQVKADLHLLNTSKHRDYVVELADEMPQDVGLSISFRGGVEDLPDGRRAARCEELFSADIVDRPAANAEGLFSDDEKDADMAVVEPEDREATGMPDGSFPVASAAQASSAIKLRGRSKTYSKSQIIKHVATRVAELVKQGKIEQATADTIAKEIEDAKKSDAGEADSQEPTNQLAERVDTSIASMAEASQESETNNKNTNMDEKILADFKAANEQAIKALTESVAALSVKVDEMTKPESLEAAVAKVVLSHVAKLGVAAPSAPAPAAPAAPAPAPVAKGYAELLDEQIKAGKSKADAIVFCTKNFPKEYAAWREQTLGFKTL